MQSYQTRNILINPILWEHDYIVFSHLTTLSHFPHFWLCFAYLMMWFALFVVVVVILRKALEVEVILIS